ncbi:MAG TPA: glycine cleavage system aminomethyltransferase GcvT, partial [Terrimicrobiaceae bacterium]|nr:glycine cleavage system aminomethyltransferase GcvT [Terrimicrobiaceae bacterium]
MSKRTPLYENHLAAGGRIVDFAGWEMPVQYTGILDEHRAVREGCGVFDISHMGEFFVRGAGSQAWLDSLLTNRVAKLAVGESQYSLLLNDQGGVIDDLIVYRIAEAEFLLVVNAAKIDEDAAWFRRHAADGVSFEDRSGDFAALAVQGPRAAEIFGKCFGRELPPERNRVLQWDGLFAVTTGYTGEAGFEIVVPAARAGEFWDRFLAAGVKPCGLGARDTLRLEMCYPLNGSDLGPDRTPLEAGLGFFVDLEKGPFIGREALAAQKAAGLPSRLVAILVEDKSPPIRPHYPVLAEGQTVAETTSGALSPSLGAGIAMAYLP